jgi:type 1 fimbria pilin
MKALYKIAALTAISASIIGTPVMAQDSETYVLNLNGSVASNCELVPEGSGNFNVDMLETGNQGFLAVAFSCNSPYTVTLQSQNGGMRHVESGGAVNIDYDIEATFAGFPTTNSANMQASPVVLVTDNDWVNILLNGGVRSGNLDLSFDNLAEYAVAGTYEDKLTIKLAADY